MARINDILRKIKSQTIDRLDRDKQRAGFQFISPNTRNNLNAVRRGMVQDTQRRGGPWSNPFNTVASDAQAVLSPIKFLKKEQPSQFAQDVAYGLRGASQLHPLQWGNMLGATKGSKIYKSEAPQTDRQKQAQSIGRSTYGLLLTAPLGGASKVANVTKRVAGNMGLGGLLGAGISKVTGGDVKQGFKEGAIQGYKNAPYLALTNPIIEKAVGRFAPVTSLLKKQALQRATAGVGNVIEDRFLNKVDGITYDNKTEQLQQDALSFLLGAGTAGNAELGKSGKESLLRLFGKRSKSRLKPKTDIGVKQVLEDVADEFTSKGRTYLRKGNRFAGSVSRKIDEVLPNLPGTSKIRQIGDKFEITTKPGISGQTKTEVFSSDVINKALRSDTDLTTVTPQKRNQINYARFMMGVDSSSNQMYKLNDKLDLYESNKVPGQQENIFKEKQEKILESGGRFAPLQPNQVGYKDLRGQNVKNEVELGSILKDFRNSKEELVHFVYVKDGKIVAHNASTSKLPNSANVDFKDFAFNIGDRVKRLGADGVFVAHNHPSGFVDPSGADINFSKSLQEKLGDKLKGFVVLDHDRLAFKGDSGTFKVEEVDLGKSYKSNAPVINNPVILKQFVSEHWSDKTGKTGVFIVNSRFQPVGYEAINTKGKSIEQINKTIQQFIRKHRGVEVFLSTNNLKDIGLKNGADNAKLATRDVMFIDSDGQLKSVTEKYNISFPGAQSFDDIKGKNKILKLFDTNTDDDGNLVFSGSYKRGDLANIQKRIDEIIGSTGASGWKQDFAVKQRLINSMINDDSGYVPKEVRQELSHLLEQLELAKDSKLNPSITDILDSGRTDSSYPSSPADSSQMVDREFGSDNFPGPQSKKNIPQLNEKDSSIESLLGVPTDAELRMRALKQKQADFFGAQKKAEDILSDAPSDRDLRMKALEQKQKSFKINRAENIDVPTNQELRMRALVEKQKGFNIKPIDSDKVPTDKELGMMALERQREARKPSEIPVEEILSSQPNLETKIYDPISDPVTDKQISLLKKLYKEKKISYEDYNKIPNLSKTEATEIIGKVIPQKPLQSDIDKAKKRLSNVVNYHDQLRKRGYKEEQLKTIGFEKGRFLLEYNVPPIKAEKMLKEHFKPGMFDEGKPFLGGLEEDVLGKKVNLLDYLRTPDRVLEKIGLGKNAVEIRHAYQDYVLELPKEINKVTEWYERVGGDDNASKRIFQYLDGQPVIIKGEELKVANEIKEYLKGWADRLGLPEDQRIAHYITHIFDDELVKKEFDPDLEKIIADKVPGSVYDPFLQERLGKEGYIEDVFKALDAYVKRATRKVHMDGALKNLKADSENLPLQSFNYVKNYTDRINMRPTEVDNLLDTAIKQSPIGYKFGQRPVANLTRKMRTMVYRATLGFNVGSALRNLSQGINTYSQLGGKWTTQGYIDLARALKNGSKELEEIGVTSDGFIQDRTISATKKNWEKLDKTAFSLFDFAETINRGSAYYGAKAKALKEGKSLEEAVQAGVDMARKTQFTFGSVDTPVALQSDLVKTLTQFQSYNVKQAEFLADMIKDKNYAGMFRYIGAWLVFSQTAGKIINSDITNALPFADILSGEDAKIASTPPFQFVKGTARVLATNKDKYGNEMEGNRFINLFRDEGVRDSALSTILPGYVQGKKTFGGTTDFLRGYSQTSGGRVKYPVEQNIYNFVKGALFGPSSTSSAKDYYDNERSPLGEKQSAIYKSLPPQQQQSYYDSILNSRQKDSVLENSKSSDGFFDNLFGPKQSKSSEMAKVFGVDEYSLMPETTNQEKAQKLAKRKTIVSNILSEAQLDNATKAEILQTELGEDVSEKDVEYYQIAKLSNDIKLGFIEDEISGITTQKELLAKLASYRQDVSGEMILANGIIDDLNDAGVISDAEKKLLKGITWNPKTGQAEYTDTYKRSISKSSASAQKKMLKEIAQILQQGAKERGDILQSFFSNNDTKNRPSNIEMLLARRSPQAPSYSRVSTVLNDLLKESRKFA